MLLIWDNVVTCVHDDNKQLIAHDDTGAGASSDNIDISNNTHYGKSKPWRSAYTDELPLNDVNASASIDGKDILLLRLYVVLCCFDIFLVFL